MNATLYIKYEPIFHIEFVGFDNINLSDEIHIGFDQSGRIYISNNFHSYSFVYEFIFCNDDDFENMATLKHLLKSCATDKVEFAYLNNFYYSISTYSIDVSIRKEVDHYLNQIMAFEVYDAFIEDDTDDRILIYKIDETSYASKEIDLLSCATLLGSMDGNEFFQFIDPLFTEKLACLTSFKDGEHRLYEVKRFKEVEQIQKLAYKKIRAILPGLAKEMDFSMSQFLSMISDLDPHTLLYFKIDP